jgi:WD40 repeat protein
LSADLRVLAQASENGTLRLRDTATGEVRSLKVGDDPIGQIALSPDGSQLITGSFRQPLRWWDLPSGTNSLLETESHRVLFSPDGSTLAVFAGPQRIELWNTSARSLRKVLLGKSPLGPAVAFSPDGHLLATASDPMSAEQSIQIWDGSSGKSLGACIGHKQGILLLAFSADGRTLASASHDNTLKLWNVATQQELLSLPHVGMDGLLFSPDGQRLVAGQRGPGGGIRFYPAPAPEENSVASQVESGDPRAD